MPIRERDDMKSQDPKLDRDFDYKTPDDVRMQEREARGASRNGNMRWASGKAGGEKDRWASGKVRGMTDSYKSGKA